MTGPMILTDYACVPPCKPCRETQTCGKAAMIVPPPPPPRLSQTDMDPVLLQCGCKIPWPVIALLGSGGKVIQCSEHGQQSITQKEITKRKRQLKNVATQLDILDLPPF